MNTSETEKNEAVNGVQTARTVQVKKGNTFRAALVVFAALTVICGVLYPAAVTIAAQALFPHEANGSPVTVQREDGSERTYGSELVGQQFSDPLHLVGRINAGSPSNLSPVSAEYGALAEARRDTFESGEFSFTGDIPAELITVSGSGLDPHVTPATAAYQVSSIVRARNRAGWKLGTTPDGTVVPVPPETAEAITSARSKADVVTGDDYPTVSDFTETYVRSVIATHTEGRFLGVFGEPRVNVLLVNLTLDGLR